MNKFTKFEAQIINELSKQQMEVDIKAHNEIVAEGKVPMMTDGYIKMWYDDLCDKVNANTSKK